MGPEFWGWGGMGSVGMFVLFGLGRLVVAVGLGLLVVYLGSYWGVRRALREVGIGQAPLAPGGRMEE
jgi:hypothetical protein